MPLLIPSSFVLPAAPLGASSVPAVVFTALAVIVVLLLILRLVFFRYSSRRAAQELFDVEGQTRMALPPVTLPAAPAPSYSLTARYGSSAVFKSPQASSFSLVPSSGEKFVKGSAEAPPQNIALDVEGSSVLSTTSSESFESVPSPIWSLGTLRSKVEPTVSTFGTCSMDPSDDNEGYGNDYARKEVALEKSVASLMNFDGTKQKQSRKHLPVKDEVPSLEVDDSSDTSVIVARSAPTTDSTDDAGDEGDEHDYARKEVTSEKSVALLMNFSGGKQSGKVSVRRNIILDPNPLDTSTVVASGSSYGVQVVLAPVKDPTTFEEVEHYSVSSGLGFPPSLASDISLHLLDPSAFGMDPDLEIDDDDSDLCELDRANLEEAVTHLLKDSPGERTVKLTDCPSQVQGLIAEYIEPATVPDNTTAEKVSAPLSSILPRARSAPMRTLGSYLNSTRSSSLKGIANVAHDKFGVAKVGRFARSKVDSPSKAGRTKAAKENLKDIGQAAKSVVKRPTWL